MQTITEEYRKLQQQLHENPNYGVASLAFSPIVMEVIKQGKIKTLSDYGAGKKNLLVGLKQNGLKEIDYFPYDPAFPEYGAPKPAELVCCIDVLEHIEPDLIDNVLRELALITTNLGFYSIHMGPAAKILADGRNAHLIQKPSSWWLPKITVHFEVHQLNTHNIMGNGIWMLVRPKVGV